MFGKIIGPKSYTKTFISLASSRTGSTVGLHSKFPWFAGGKQVGQVEITQYFSGRSFTFIKREGKEKTKFSLTISFQIVLQAFDSDN
jgi:hypothetical protein